ncbi:hypothetical protein Lesp02_40780 [Lentzea sp. NBRC 105346]|uniref:DUF4397 domain-containing protein n=1 Tax=Lentzea sp. NBRC 105346 TaxID=3032205 RepID=UPI0024A46C6C|nr:DUF4397 domain-containing protein [Lentzea sp. NBRC 105346]GLZ31890.1 hypothetical protein Lesp02_40780 [Lentzea sp. NBRC 105346]
MRVFAVLAILLAAIVVVPAQAATGTYMRLAHLSPDTPQVDVTVTSFEHPEATLRVPGVGYGVLSDYQLIQPGTYTIAMRPAGADPNSPPVISASLSAAEGKAYTVAGLGKFAALALKVIEDDITLPPSGQARMRVVNAAPSTGELKIVRGDAAVVDNAAFGSATPYTLVAAGVSGLKVTPKSGGPLDLPVTLEAGAVYSVLVLENQGRLSTVVRVDAKGAAVVPVGGMETGVGGMDVPWQPFALCGLVVIAFLALRRRLA